jgi:hypothetical protein
MFRHRDVIMWLALEHFKEIYKLLLLEKKLYIYHLLHNEFTHSAFLFNSLNAKLNPIYHLVALLGAHPIFHFSRVRVNNSKF